MKELSGRVERAISTIRRKLPFQRIVVAVSGGGDSMAMAELLSGLREKQSMSLTIASFDHGLRSSAADEVRLVQRLAEERWRLPFVSRDLSVAFGSGVQERARAARYAALHEIALAHDADAIAVGHTVDDRAETVLMAVLRGRGLDGLCSMRMVRDDGVCRPLWETSRAELRDLLRLREVPYVEDPSNDDDRFERSRVRRLLTDLQPAYPSLSTQLGELGDDAERAVDVLDAAAERFCLGSPQALELTALRALPSGIRVAVWRKWLPGISRRGCLELETAVVHGRGEVRVGAGRTVYFADGRVSVINVGESA